MIIVIWLTIERKSLQLTQKGQQLPEIVCPFCSGYSAENDFGWGFSNDDGKNVTKTHVPNNPSWKASFPSEHMPFSLLVFCLDCFLISNF